MLGTRTAHLIILCIRVIKKKLWMFWNVNSSPLMVFHLFHHCIITAVLRKTYDAKFCITAAFYSFRFPLNISSIKLVTAIHSLWLRMVAVYPSTIWNLKEKKCISKSVLLFIKIFSTAELNRGHSISLLYRLHIKRSNNKDCMPSSF